MHGVYVLLKTESLFLLTPLGNAGQVFIFYDNEGNFCEEHTVATGYSRNGGVLATSSKSLFYTHVTTAEILYFRLILANQNQLIQCTKEKVWNDQ